MASTSAYELSAQQRLLWSDHDDSARGCAVVHLDGTPTPNAVRSALAQVVAAHNVLSTTFRPQPGRRFPLQVPGAMSEPVLEVLAAGDAATESAAAEAALAVPLNAVDGPVLAAVLATGTDGRSVLAVTAVPLVADPSSLNLLARQLVTALAGTPIEPAAVQYVAYAAWQREQLDDPATVAWRGEAVAAKAAELAKLPLPYENAPAPSRGRLTRIPLEGRPETPVALAAYALGLSRLLGSAEVVIGLIHDARGLAELRGVLGPFERITPLLLEPVGSVPDYLAAAHAAYEAGLADETRAVSRTDISLWRAAIRVREDEPATLVATPPPAPAGLVLELAKDSAALLYDSAFVAAPIAEGLAHQITGLADTLQSGSADPVTEVVAPAALTFEEALRPARPRVDLPRSRFPAVSKIQSMAGEQPSRALLADGKAALTVAELASRMDEWRDAHISAGAGRGSLVAVGVPRGTTAVSALLGVLACGAAMLPIDPQGPAQRTKHVLDEVGPTVLVVGPEDEAWAMNVAGGAGVLVATPDGRPRVVRSADAPVRTMEGCCYLLTTSGSTGRPKTIAITVDNVLAYRDAMAEVLRLGSTDVALHSAAFTFSSAMRQLLLPLEAGASLRVASVTELRDPARLLDIVVREGITVLDLVPSYWRRIVMALDSDRGDLIERVRGSKLRLMLSASEPLPPDLVARLFELAPPSAQLVNMYGQTETTGIVAARVLHPADIDGETVDLGHPLPGVGLALVAGKTPVPPGQVGEIVVCGDTVGARYLDAPNDPFSTVNTAEGETARVFRTGDLARRSPDGRIDFVGRIDRQTKVRGIRISLAEVEAALVRHPAVVEAAVTIEVSPRGENELHAYLIPVRDQRPTTVDLTSFLDEIVPSAMIPTRFTSLTEFPRLVSGKVNMVGLHEAAEFERRGGPVTNYVAPRTPDEERMTQMWADVLSVERVGIEDSFFDLGGHSLLGIDLIQRVRTAFGVELEWSDLFAARTVTGMMGMVLAAPNAGARP